MSIVGCFLYSLSKKLEFAPVASAITAVHRDRLILASYVRLPEIQPLVSRGQIVSADLPLLTDGRADGQTDKYNFSAIVVIMIPLKIKDLSSQVWNVVLKFSTVHIDSDMPYVTRNEI